MQAFGNLDQLRAELQKYLTSGDYASFDMPATAQVDDSSFGLRPFSRAQVDIVRAEFLSRVGRSDEARARLKEVLNADPKNVSARVSLGYMAFRAGNYEEAHKWCDEAVSLDEQDFLAHHCLAVSLLKKGIPDARAAANIETNFRTAMRLNPSFVPPYVGLAVLLSMHAKTATEAQRYIEQAIQLDPGSVDLRINQSNILMNINKPKEAIATLELGQKLAHTPEEVAAVENILQSIRRYESDKADLQARNSAARSKNAKSLPFGITPPVATYAPQAEYSEKGHEAKREGICTLNLIVGVDGKPYDVVVAHKLGLGLDEKAVEAVQKWRFEPARRNGKPIFSRFTVNMSFRLFGNMAEKYVQLSEKAKAGDAAAEFELANAFFAGRDIPKDESQGLLLLQRAAQDGLPEAQFQMAERTYRDGHKDKDYVSAYVWYTLARRGGLSQSEPKLAELETRMTPDQLSEAQKRLEKTASPAK